MAKTRSQHRRRFSGKDSYGKSPSVSQWKPGNYVWGCMNKTYWAGVIVSHKELNFKVPQANKSWVFWFGDHRVSEVKNADICCFVSHFERLHRQKFGRGELPNTWRRGVAEAIREYGSPETLNYNYEQLLEYAGSKFGCNVSKTEACITTFVFDKLSSIRNKNKQDNFDTDNKIGASRETRALLKQMLDGTRNFKDICLACYTTDVSAEHPLFEGCICLDCKDKIKKTYFVIGDDDIKYFCAICGCLGNMVVCSTRGCGFVYCSKCLNDLCLPGARQDILVQEPWFCFICDTNTSNGLIKSRGDWKARVQLLFCNSNPVINRPLVPEVKQPIRVLSLFDGIGTGLHALIKLNIVVECYYSCEIDEDSINVAKKNYPGGIVLLGDVRSLTEDNIKEILPIDLLIGGSPCNDLSLANPYRRGLYEANGTGVLFFEFYRILTNLQMYNSRPFFWFYENVASMSIQNRVSITRFLQCEPKLIDAAWVSSQSRPRLFWGNLPTLQDQRFVDDGPNLQNYLMPGRRATVKKIRTVTTKSNSLKQGCQMESPILHAANIDIVELEEIFGFPRNYTQVGNLSKTGRQVLLGRAWSVQAICVRRWVLRSILEVKAVTYLKELSLGLFIVGKS